MPYEVTDFFPSLLQLQSAIEKTDADLTATGEAAAREIRRLDGRIDDLSSRLDVLPLVPGMPGMQGEQGIPGTDGRDGISVVGRDGLPGRDGKDGVPGLVWRGQWRKGEYKPGDAVAWDSASYICTAPTKSEPPGKGWDVLAEKGDKGAKGKDGSTTTYYQRTTTAAPETIFDNGTVKFNREGVMVPRGTVVRAVGDDGFAIATWNSKEEATVLGVLRSDCASGDSAIVQQAGRFELPGLTDWHEYYVDDRGRLTAQAVPEGKWKGVVGFTVVGALIIEPQRPSYRIVAPDTIIVTAKNVYGPIPALSPVTVDSGEFILAKYTVSGCALTASDLGDMVEIRTSGAVVGDWHAISGAPLVYDTLYYLSFTERGKITTDNTGQIFSIGVATNPTTLWLDEKRVRPEPDWPDLVT